MLKSLMLRKKIDAANKQLSEARAKKEALEKREADLEIMVREAETDEEKAAVDEEIEKFENEKAEANADETIENLEKNVAEMEAELADIEARQETTPEPAPATEEPATQETRTKEITKMHKRFADFTIEERSALVERAEVKEFLERTRELIKNKRSVTGASYLIPDVVLDIIRANVEDYSKLINAVNKQSVPGTARQNIMGLIPEAVWTEMCAKLNELDFSFAQKEVDGFKVGGFVPVCNALIADSDINLLQELIAGIGQAIGYALDKAILYGTGVKMPTGVFKAIDADAAIKATNVINHAGTVKGVDLFKAILGDTKAINKKYSKNALTWVMSSSTFTDLQIEAMGINAAGAIVSGMSTTMPVVGGEVILLDFIPSGTIFVGKFDNYLLAERAGVEVKISEECKFIEDQTVIKGTARYDGKPVIVDAFAVIGVGGATPAVTDVTFAPDTANPVG